MSNNLSKNVVAPGNFPGAVTEDNEPVIKSEIKFHIDEMQHITTQPTENLILRRNAKLRNNEGVIRDLGSEDGETWGRMVASIPFIMFEKALRDGYDLNCKDSKKRSKEMQRYLSSEEGKLCLIRGKM